MDMEQLRGRDFIDLADFTSDDVNNLLALAKDLKQKQKNGEPFQPLRGKTLGMIFDKSSTRTRVSFEVGMFQLGGHALFLSGNDSQLGRGETIADTARVLSRYVDGIMIRTYSHQAVREMAEYASVPVINALTDLHHPCQVLADLLTIKEYKGSLSGLTVAYVGDGNNMAHSWLVGAPLAGLNMRVASPEGYMPTAQVIDEAKQLAAKAGTNVWIGTDPLEAVYGADVIYTDTWTSMGQEAERAERLAAFANYQVNEVLCGKAKPDFLFMHCLPAHHGEEVTADVFEGKHSVVFDEAENRLHAQKAIMAAMM